MNDEMRERLAAYLDGALSPEDRATVEAQLARSEDLRRELESLKALSASLKSLPREKLPPGFLARLEARRHRALKPKTWVFLPPAARPLAFAMSTAVVALVVWDRTRTPEVLHVPVGWQGDRAAVVSEADAPVAQLDFTKQVTGGAGGAGLAANEAKTAVSAPARKSVRAPGAPLEGEALVAQAFTARSEEERSAFNERQHQYLEKAKKEMGVVKVLQRADDDDQLAYDVAEPPAARVSERRIGSVAAVRGAAMPQRMGALAAAPPAPPDEPDAAKDRAKIAALLLTGPETLQAAWAASGAAGDPPAADFKTQSVALLPEPGLIVGIQDGKKVRIIRWRPVGGEPVLRFHIVPASDKPTRFVQVPPAP